MSAITTSQSLDFLAGGGEMGERIRSFDWAKTSLGPLQMWPQSLKTSVSLILNSQHPMWIGWGAEMTFLYNDAYKAVLGTAKHSEALGRPAAEVWAEIWHICGPLADKVFAKGEATFVDDVRLFMDRGDYLEETFYSFSYSPIREESGKVGGLFCPSADVTAKNLNARRSDVLARLAAGSLMEKTVERACRTAAEILATSADIPLAMIYLTDAAGQHVRLEQAIHLDRVTRGTRISPQIVPLAAAEQSSGIPEAIIQVISTLQPQLVAIEKSRELPVGSAMQPITEAIILPVTSRGEECFGVFVAGVNPARKLDAEYRTFFTLVAGQIAMAIANARSYEEERKRSEALAELDRAKTIFFSNISHELRTPLTLMLGPIEEILQKPDGRVQPENRELAIVAHRSGLRLLKLVNTLLDFSRIEAGRVEASFEPTDLATYTTELASVFAPAMERAGLKFVLDCPPLPEPVFVDREMWEKIVVNLLSNALKFTFQGEVKVSLQTAGKQVELIVADTGVGIPAAELPRIFERFHRVRGARSRSHEGTGIGLALVQELARLHGGDVHVESREDRGTQFTVRLSSGAAHLPAERVGAQRLLESTATGAISHVEEALRWLPDTEEQGPADHSGAEGSNGDGARLQSEETLPRVLLADDNSDMRGYVRRVLKNRYQVIAVSDGQAALDRALADPPDLVISDVMMPHLDGFGLVRELRQNPITREIPVIMLSARAGEEARLEGIENGADDYLVKPFNARELIARVKTNLELARVRREGQQRVRLALSAGKMGDWELSLADQRLTSSTQCKANFGRNADDPFSYEMFFDAIHPEDREAVKAAVHHALTTNGEYRAEYRCIWPDGTVHWINASGLVFCGADHKASRLVGVTMDITERKAIEARERQIVKEALAAAEANAKFRTFFDQGIYFAGVMENDGTFIEANHLAYESCGFTREGEMGKKFWDCGWWNRSTEVQELVREGVRHAREGNKFQRESGYFVADGSMRYVDMVISPVKDDNGKIIFLAAHGIDITERKRAEEAVRENAERLKLAVEAAELGIYVWYVAEDRVTWENDRIYEMFGRSRDEKPISAEEFGARVVHPEDAEKFKLAIARTLETGERFYFQGRFFRKDGSNGCLEFTGQLERSADGTPERMLGTVRDVTEREKAGEILRDTQERLEASLTATEIATWTWDVVTNRVMADEKLARLFSLSEAELKEGRIENYVRSIHPDDKGAVEAGIQLALEGPNRHYEVDYRLIQRDGSIRWVTARGRVEVDDNERPIRFPGVTIDITARKQAEEKLQKSESRYRTLFESIDEGFCIVELIFDSQGKAIDFRFQEVNPAFEKQTGIKDATGKRMREIAPQHEQYWFDTLGQVFRTGEAIRLENRAEALNRWFEVYVFRVDNIAGEGVGIIYSDITQRKLSEEALRESRAALDFALESAQVGDWDLDLTTDTARRSSRHDRCFGYNEPIPTWGFTDFIRHVHPDDREWVEREFRRALTELKDWRFECRVIWPDGSEHWIAAHGSLYYGKEGKPTRMLGIVANITERKQAEAALLESKDRISNILESITDGFATVDKDWRITYLNQRAKEIIRPLETTSSDLLGQNLWERFPDLIGTPVEENYRRCMNEHVTVQLEMFYPPLDSWLDIRAYPLQDGISIYFQDISKRKRAEEDIARLTAQSEQQRRLYVTILSHTLDLVYVFDLEHRFTYANKALLQMWGKSWEEAAGKNCWQLGYEPWHAAMHDREIDEVIASRQPIRGEVPFSGANGRRIYEYILVPVIGADGAVEAIAGTTRDITERKLAEERVRDSRERLQAALDGSGAGTFRWNIQDNAMEWDENLDRLFGLPPGQTVRSLENFISRVHSEERSIVIQNCERCRREGADLSMEFRVLGADGSVHWLDTKGKTFFDASGQPQYMAGMCIDITLRKLAQQLEASQKKVLELIAQDAPLSEVFVTVVRMIEEQSTKGMFASILLMDAGGTHLLLAAAPNLPEPFNRAVDGICIGPAAASCGAAAFQKKTVITTDIAHDPLWTDYAEAALAHNLRASWSAPIFSTSGQLLGVFALYYPEVRGPSESDIGLVDVATRIVSIAIERSRAETELRTAAERLRFMAESMPQKIFTALPDGSVDYFNRQWMDFTGFTFQQINSWGWTKFIHPDDVEKNLHLWKTSLVTGADHQVEHRFQRKDGEYRWHLTRAQALRNNDGQILMWIGSSTDIEDQKRAEEKLERIVAQRTAKLRETVSELEAFSYSIAHDMRAPLRSLQGFSDILMDEYGGKIDSAGLGYLRRIANSAGRMDRLIQDILNYSKVVRAELPMEPVNVEKLLQDMLETYPMFLPDRVEVIIEAPIPKIIGNEAALTQCLSNLLGNAAKFVPPGVKPVIHVRAEIKGPFARILIQDNGIGIPPDQHKKIFEIFQRVERNYEGTGIGLAIVKKSVERMSGRVGVESTPAKGSTFWIELQLA